MLDYLLLHYLLHYNTTEMSCLEIKSTKFVCLEVSALDIRQYEFCLEFLAGSVRARNVEKSMVIGASSNEMFLNF